MAIDFGDIAARYAQARWDQATQPFTDPEAYMNNRMMQNYGVDLNGNTKPKSTTIQYGDNGRPETITTKTEVGTPPPTQDYSIGADYSLAPQMPISSQGMQMPAVPAVGMQMPQQPIVQQPTPVVAQTRAVAQPQVVPQQEPVTAISPEQVAQPTTLPELPQPGPGVQVAGPMVAGAVPAPAPAPAPAPVTGQNVRMAPGMTVNAVMPSATAPAPAPQVRAEAPPAWSNDMIKAGTNAAAWHKIAGNEDYPEEVRRAAGEKAFQLHSQTSEQNKAKDIADRAAQGDRGAANTVAKDLASNKPEGSYIRAYLLNRLGFTELAKEEQDKISGKYEKPIGQATVDGKHYTVQYDKNGTVIGAWDAGGRRQSDDVKASIQAQGYKPGTHAFSSTAASYTIPAGDPNAGQEYRQRFNSITGTYDNVITTGPDAGKAYTGRPGLEKSVQTAAAKMDYGLANDLYKKHSGNILDMMREYETLKGAMSPDERNLFLNRYGYGQVVAPGSAGATISTPPAVSTQTSQVPGSQTAPRPGGAPAPAGAPAGAPVQVQQGGGQITGVPRVGGPPSTSIAGMREQRELSTAAGKEAIQVGGARSQKFNEYLDSEVAPQATAGNTVRDIRKQQFAIFDRPGIDSNKIFGLANGAGRSPSDQTWTIVRDILAGKVDKSDDKVRERLANLGLSPAEQSALADYINLNATINATSLKSTAGAGSVSDAEQRANRERNVDPTKVPALAAYNGMAQSQFNADMSRYKADWAIDSKATNTLQLEREWRRKQQELVDIYTNVAKKRIEFIQQNGGDTNAVREGYRRFPVPEYDAATGKWIKTKPLADILGR